MSHPYDIELLLPNRATGACSNSLSLWERAGVRVPLDVRHESGGRNELRPYNRTQSVVAAQFIAPIPRILRFTKHFRPDCVRPGCTNTGFREFSPCMRD